ncbi:MAG: D-alanyl-D-alanine carboxypeptidase/D-alanyl-D-alanine-endopeptidase [Saprospiraceae bacterium]|nr:D-alanyl-D-alanine carboxypeptidase/D-alanyl-D-alanine-endopeptidase [Saprospiraceae bacterium]
MKKAFNEFINDPVFKHAQLAVQFTDFESRKILLKQNEHKTLIPASVIKLITSALLIDTLGPEFKFKTEILLRGQVIDSGIFNGCLIFVGSGDPSFCSPYLKEAVQIDSIVQIISNFCTKNGIKSIQGGIRIENSYINDPPENPEWLYYDLGNYYGAGCSAFNFRENEISLGLSAAPQPGEICPVAEIWPDYGLQKFHSEVRGNSSTERTEVFVLGNSNSDQKWIRGKWKCCTQDTLFFRAAMHDPSLYFAKMLTEKLKLSGLEIGDMEGSGYERDSNRANKIYIGHIYSPPLHVLIQRALYRSVNLYCESFLHELGSVYLKNTTRDSILAYIDDKLSREVFGDEAFELEDGSGLSPKNFISAENMLKFLERYRYCKDDLQYWKLLPDIHQSGALKKYMSPKKNAHTALHLKSGSMERVRAYAGYLVKNQKPVAGIAIFVNNDPGKSELLQKHIAKFLDKVMLLKL